MESLGTGGINLNLLEQALREAHQGYSPDRVIADPDLNREFQSACDRLGVAGSPFARNLGVLNRRKQGGLAIRTRTRTSFDDREYRFASEIAARIIERRDQESLDNVLCNPEKAVEFDRFAIELAPGFSSVRYRWAALSLRKSRSLQPEVAARLLRPDDAKLVSLQNLSPADIPPASRIYMFLDTVTRSTLYVGEASNLRARLSKHIDHSDNKQLARFLWDNDTSTVRVEYYVLPDGTSKRELRAIELEQIRSRMPTFNILGIRGE